MSRKKRKEKEEKFNCGRRCATTCGCILHLGFTSLNKNILFKFYEKIYNYFDMCSVT